MQNYKWTSEEIWKLARAQFLARLRLAEEPEPVLSEDLIAEFVAVDDESRSTRERVELATEMIVD